MALIKTTTLTTHTYFVPNNLVQDFMNKLLKNDAGRTDYEIGRIFLGEQLIDFRSDIKSLDRPGEGSPTGQDITS